MKLSHKLYLCASIGLAGLAVVGSFSVLGMRNVGGQIRQLTERSTPAQLKTIDFQRALQEHIANLLRIQSAANGDDLARLRQEADTSLADVRRISGELDALKGEGAGGGSGKEKAAALADTTTQIARTVGEKIAATDASAESLQSMNTQLQTMSKQLALLDESIRKVQTRATENLTSANESASRIGVLQGNIQSLKNHLQDMKMAIMDMSTAATKNDAMAARTRFNTTNRFIVDNPLMQDIQTGIGKMLAESLLGLQKAINGPEGLLLTRIALIAKPDAEKDQAFQASVKQAIQKLTDLLAYMETQIEAGTAGVAKENERFGNALKGADAAGGILMINSQITALGSAIEGGVGLLSGVRTGQQLDQIKADLSEKLDSADKLARKEADLLSRAHYTGEMRYLKSAIASLTDVHTKLFEQGGVVETLQQALSVEEKANTLSMKIREMVENQRTEGMKGVTLAQQEQEKAILAVNGIIRSSFMLIVVLGTVCLVLGAVLANLLVRSITRPTLRVAEGLMNSSGELASASATVSAASKSLSDGTSEQASSLEETSSSLEEMSSMTRQNADHAREAQAMVTAASRIVEKVQRHMVDMSRAVGEITRSSEETGKIIKTIDEIAFQTNLLALNAAVEAARAGDAGAGFAVVADEVRNLALRSAEAARNTSSLIENTIKAVHNGRELTEATQEAFRENADISQKIGHFVDEIATASREQAEGIAQINQAFSEIDKVTQSTAAIAEESAAAAEQMNAQAQQMNGYVDDLIAVIGAGADGSASSGLVPPAVRDTDTDGDRTPVAGRRPARLGLPRGVN